MASASLSAPDPAHARFDARARDPHVPPPRVRFPEHGAFGADLERAVDAYFAASGRSRHGGWRLHVKAVLVFAWLGASYAALLSGRVGPVGAALLAISAGLAMAGIGFCVMHDANHGASTGRPLLDRCLGFSCDLVGGSSYLWRYKHNVLHHTFTNIEGIDTDTEGNALLRFGPAQPLRAWHRWQHLYVWLLLAVYPLGWWFIDDFDRVIRRRIGRNRIPRPKGAEMAALLVGKLVFFCWAFAIPAWIVRSWLVVPYTLLAVGALGLALAIVFQLAHCVGEADFLDVARPGEIGRDWMVHQVATTVDFARGNRWLGWYLGGLNFQVEHHLFPRISHVHYPALSAIVERTCAEHGLRYRAQPTFTGALGAHVRWLRRMGVGPPAVP